MQKQSKTRSKKKLFITRGSVALVAAVVAASVYIPMAVRADQYDTQIQALQGKNAQAQQSLNGLQLQASNYQDAINKLQQQITAVQNAININQAKQVSLQKQIVQVQAEIAYQKQVLGDDLRTMYVDNNDMTTIEMLATSNNLSDYVDKQEYEIAVQNKIQTLLDKIAQLQAQLVKEKAQVDQLLKTQELQRSQLNNDEAQQNRLLAMNQSQQDTYNAQLAANNSKISELRAEQYAAELAAVRSGNVQIESSGNCGGGYPGDATNGQGGRWGCDYGLDSNVDGWGMLNRECVSYTAWKVYETYGYMPYWGGVGNASEWPADARNSGIPTGSTPKVGSVAIATQATDPAVLGPAGHAMWVEGIEGNGEILVSQFNYDFGQGPGMYSEMAIPASYISTYIYFGR